MISRELHRPLYETLHRDLDRTRDDGGGSNYDPDALAYIEAVEAALASSITTIQKDSINEFYVTEKTTSRWTLLRRVFLPMWNNEDANSICLKSLTPGTFVGSPAIATGYVQGNGTDEYFDIGSDFSSDGLSPDDAYVFGLTVVDSSLFIPVIIGSGSENPADLYTVNGTDVAWRWCGSGNRLDTSSESAGIISASRKSGVRTMYRRTTASRSILQALTNADEGSTPTSNVYAMAVNMTDTPGSNPSRFSDAQLGAFGYGLGLTDAQDSGFTDSLKTLWETCTGLSLP